MSKPSSQLNRIQQNLKAPKGQRNNFGKYNYRSCEDILEAVKPLLGECTITLSDEIIAVGDRIYVKATAMLNDGTSTAIVTAMAREADTRKGMDASQITGSASSYARKYALNGLFAIDDTKDADTHEAPHEQETPKADTAHLKLILDEARVFAADQASSEEAVTGHWRANSKVYEQIKAQSPETHEELVRIHSNAKKELEAKA